MAKTKIVVDHDKGAFSNGNGFGAEIFFYGDEKTGKDEPALSITVGELDARKSDVTMHIVSTRTMRAFGEFLVYQATRYDQEIIAEHGREYWKQQMKGVAEAHLT